MSEIFNLERCSICGRSCLADRINTDKSFCKTDDKIYIASIFVHKGEEPPVSGDKGICNIFFAHCNMQCVYCQNYQISNNNEPNEKYLISIEDTVSKIIEILETGVPSVGFVSASHFIPQMIQIIEQLHKKNYYPTIVYNTNGYDDLNSLIILESYVDVYLPDFKYAFDDLGIKFSNTPKYSQKALIAIKEMHRQKGDLLYINKAGYAESGVIIRHLVLPNNVENSLKVLDIIAEISKNIHVSLMSQYYPTYKALEIDELNRPITKDEYKKVVEHMNKLGLDNGWIQEYESKDNYKPDFESENPFAD